MLGRFSDKAQKAIAIAESIAFDFGHSCVGTEHLLLAFAKIKESKLREALEKQDAGYERIKEELLLLLGKKETQPFYLEYTIGMKRLLERAAQESKKYHEDKVSLEVLSYMLIYIDDSIAYEILKKCDVDLESLKEELKSTIKQVSELDSIEDLVNLNEKMRQSSEVILTRDKEMGLLVDALLRKKKPNAILIGEPGVGKTALVEHLAQLIASGKVKKELRDKIIYELDIASVVAGTKYRGEFEEKLKKIIRKVKDDKRAIIFIDEIHNIIGAGGAEGAIDASNILKPYLARGEFQCIGATTYDEYVKIFEKEKGLQRRFQQILVDEPSSEETLAILKKIRASFADFHAVHISDKILAKIVEYTKNYISDRFFPDKAIDVLDCALVKSRERKEKELSEQTVIDVIEMQNHIKINKERKSDLLEAALTENIFGQDDAASRIVSNIRTIENGLYDDNRPLAILLFVGPTGVGKTEIAKLIAKSYFGSSERLIKVDMQEYSESSSVAKLIGSPPGYVGHETQSFLVDKIRKMPHCVVLIDEVEKGHRDVLDLFLNVFDEGFFIDAAKRKVDFRNAIIILTSNLGHGDEVYQRKSLGFLSTLASEDEINRAIKKKMRPEFINRLDDVIIFSSLNSAVCLQLVEKYQKEYQRKLSFEVALEQSDFDKILAQSEVTRFGARSVRREVKKRLQEKINEKEKADKCQPS